MKKNIKKIQRVITSILVLMISCTILDNNLYFVKADEREDIIVEISNEAELENVDGAAEVVIVDSENIEVFDKEEINEILDDGVSIFDMNSDYTELSEYFNDTDIKFSDASLGYHITKNGNKVNITPIGVEIVCEEGQEYNITNADYNRLVNDVKLEEEDYLLLKETQSVSTSISEVTEQAIAYLQSSNTIGNAYAEVSRTTYYYRKHWYDRTTVAQKKGKAAESGWNKMGYSTVSLASYNAGSFDKKRYDAFWTTARVGALNDYYLINFTVQSRLYDQNNCTIIDVTELKGGDEQKTVSIGTGVEASEEGLSASFSTGYSYSYDPNGLSIKNVNGDSELQPNWVCSKKYDDAEPNEWYRIKPMILVKTPKGNKKETKVSSRVKDLKFVGASGKVYNVANRTGAEYVYLTVKNHKMVGFYE